MNIEEVRILAHSQAAIDRQRERRWLTAAVGGFSLLGMVAAFAIVPAADHAGPELRTIIEQIPLPTTIKLDAGGQAFLREEHVQRSDTLASLLNRLGVSEREAIEYLRQNQTAQKLTQQLRPGNVVRARSGDSGELYFLQLPLLDSDAVLIVERRGNGFVTYEQSIELETRMVIGSGEIRSSWFEATDAADLPDAIAGQLVGIFGSEIDFHRDLRKGDRFSLVYEVFAHQGQVVRSGRILAAEVTSRQKVLQAYWFKPEKGEGAYYTADGKSVRKPFLLSPIEFSRVTSGFSDARFHPILQTLRAHKGVDYAAPIGTPVLAVADGVVDSADFQNGYGNLIVVKHQGTYSTAYGHLDDFAAGLRKGTQVRQGETIGYVGQTGLATGPHLHYEFRINDEQVDPLAIALPTSIPLDRAQLGRFKGARLALRGQLDMAKQVKLAALVE
jgi:murein DD-endopeptidase MepM/ murein hydrolase activator NlpD